MKNSKLKAFLPLIIVVVLIVVLTAVSVFTPKAPSIAKNNDMKDIGVLIAVGDNEKAVAKLDQYDGKYGGDDGSYYNRAVALANMGKYEDAMTYLRKCSNDYQGRSAEYQFQCGECERLLGNESSAVSRYTKALEINPDHYESLVRLGAYNFYNNPDCYVGLEYLRSAVNVYDKDAASLFLLAKAYLNVAYYDEAKFYLDEACKYSYDGVVKAGAQEWYDVIEEHETKGGLR